MHTSEKIVDKASNYKVISGPAFSNGLPNNEEWQSFTTLIESPDSLALTDLWYEKAALKGGVPFRPDFSFTDFVKFGRNLFICKREENNRWLTTFCGDNIVERAGFELTGKYLDEIADERTLKFWMDNIILLSDQERPCQESFTLEYANKKYLRCTTINFPLKSKNSDFSDMFISYELFA